MGSPFISICIPTYKRPDLLKKLLDSIQMQNFRDFEVIISDNSPDDSVKELADPYGKMLPLFYEKNVPAVSATTNCNNAMQRAKGSWVKVMHDDDWFQAADALRIPWPETRELSELPVTATRDGRIAIIEADTVAATLHTLTGWAIDRDEDIDGLTVTRPSLEDIYLELTDADTGGAEQ